MRISDWSSDGCSSDRIDRGQIEGGFVQGMGWLTCEELRWDDAGRLLTDAPRTYKIPTVGDVPEDFPVSLFQRSKPPGTEVIFMSEERHVGRAGLSTVRYSVLPYHEKTTK